MLFPDTNHWIHQAHTWEPCMDALTVPDYSESVFVWTHSGTRSPPSRCANLHFPTVSNFIWPGSCPHDVHRLISAQKFSRQCAAVQAGFNISFAFHSHAQLNDPTHISSALLGLS